MNQYWKIALAQMAIQDGDKEANLLNIEKNMQKAYEQSADILLLPELSVTGLVSGSEIALLAEAREGQTLKRFQQLMKTYPIYVAYSFIESEGEDLFITTCVVDPEGQPLHYYRKTHLFTEENQLFSKGDLLETFEIEGAKFGLLTCYDIEFPEAARTLTLKGALILLVNSANMSPYENQHRIFCQARAMENQCYVVYCNRIGENDHYIYHGESFVVGPTGKLLLDLQSDTEAMGIATLSRNEKTKCTYHYLKERRPELYS